VQPHVYCWRCCSPGTGRAGPGCGGRQASAPAPSGAAGGSGMRGPQRHPAEHRDRQHGRGVLRAGGGSASWSNPGHRRQAEGHRRETGGSYRTSSSWRRHPPGRHVLATAPPTRSTAGSVRGKPQQIAAAGQMYPNYTSWWRAPTPASTRGPTCAQAGLHRSPRSGTELLPIGCWAAAGLNPEGDIAAQRLDLGAAVDGMRAAP